MWLQACDSKRNLNYHAKCHIVLIIKLHNKKDSEFLGAESFIFSEEMPCLVIPGLSGPCSISLSPDVSFHFYDLPQMYHDTICLIHLMQCKGGELGENYTPCLVSQRWIAVWVNEGEGVEKRKDWQISHRLTWEFGGAISMGVTSPICFWISQQVPVSWGTECTELTDLQTSLQKFLTGLCNFVKIASKRFYWSTCCDTANLLLFFGINFMRDYW